MLKTPVTLPIAPPNYPFKILMPGDEISEEKIMNEYNALLKELEKEL